VIPFASQRGDGQDLATHLLNAQDNEFLELADLRGAVAGDLHGAFAEWEAQAAAMTRCRKYLYSLSVNPDHRQGAFPRELYAAYVERVETALGLEAQPRAMVIHIKDGREHAHVIWSRIDVQEMKAVHLAFDREKLMSVTRSFAKEHGIELAPGYHKLEDRARQTHRQLSLADKAQQEKTGITREAREAVVTDLWKRRDTPESFLCSLEDAGYLLAHGKRPFALVDRDGQVNSLPKLINDKAATTKAVRAFLGEAGAEENLPTVDEAQRLAAAHRRTISDQKAIEAQADKRAELKTRQEARRAALDLEAEALKTRQQTAREQQQETHAHEQAAHQCRHDLRSDLIKAQRDAAKPQGLAGFLSRVSGVSYLRGQFHTWQDRRREDLHAQEQLAIQERQSAERLDLERRQTMQALDMERKRRALDQTEARERQSLERTLAREVRVESRSRSDQKPAPTLEPKPPGRPAAPQKAMNRFLSPEFEARDAAPASTTPIRKELSEKFEQAAQPSAEQRRTSSGDSANSGGSGDRASGPPRSPPQDQTRER